ncbi:pyruvate dehydrogenase (acetyl-transferring) E1 component subunit alpha [Candidatus Hydrogenosomobacter endosymbioticus]|uniref:Pyruvate dehydrogenase E1 component subunit alpha n=1 Tax=Candidatus Hydrogenosomobacter endosymbioticus TaxID=2558174 RepID=A0ABM7V840_9PROT|nr:pyruvate dehydrogenase (acetyl-transferring) E1 component subunit alpha [Candidatus Hydrogenosomobacter endosymbioticus]BDB95924.1 pyruvate dehydrogenase E1 component subunit alpha [Candidatus Hydrogenosomobacter endosymbioticus]
MSVSNAPWESFEFLENRAVCLSELSAEKIYYSMRLIRNFEDKSAQMYSRGKIVGFCHLYSGQESIAVGTCLASEELDTMITSYRSRGHLLAKKVDPGALMAELFGKIDGCSKGKGGAMHMFCKEKNFYGGNGIVGAQTSIGTGLALSHKYNNDGGVSLIFLGDGAANQGQFFESLNMAALWKLPAIYVIENNRYAMGTSVSRACAGELYKRGEPFGIQGLRIDATDVVNVYDVTKQALSYVRKHSQPLVIEMMTYRFRGHSMSDPGTYRTAEELELAKKTMDPIEIFKNTAKKNKLLNDADFDLIDAKVQKEIDDATEFAENSEFPNNTELYTDITASNWFNHS